MERVTEPMSDASVKHGIRRTGSRRIGRKAGGAPVPAGVSGIRGMCGCTCQSFVQLAVAKGRNPHGVKSVPTADEGTLSELGNLAAGSPADRWEMVEATDDHRREGRSLRSSPRAGKPLTWRRKAVDRANRQEADR